MLAADFPLLDAFLTILWIFLFALWLMILFRIIWDIFRSHDLRGWAKAGWFLFILFLPLIGVLVYLIVRGGSMHERDIRAAKAQEEALQQYIKGLANDSGPADELAKLVDLKSKGIINEDEFERAKTRLLS